MLTHLTKRDLITVYENRLKEITLTTGTVFDINERLVSYLLMTYFPTLILSCYIMIYESD